jgi:transcriptional regulator with XRE-family HTH domain
MLTNLMNEALKSRGVSVREAARQMSVAHTTIIRVLRGKNIDLPTLHVVCTWLGVNPAEVLGANHEGGVASKIALLVESSPELGRVLAEAVRQWEDGQLTDEDIREIIAYANYRIGASNAKDES